MKITIQMTDWAKKQKESVDRLSYNFIQPIRKNKGSKGASDVGIDGYVSQSKELKRNTHKLR